MKAYFFTPDDRINSNWYHSDITTCNIFSIFIFHVCFIRNFIWKIELEKKFSQDRSFYLVKIALTVLWNWKTLLQINWIQGVILFPDTSAVVTHSNYFCDYQTCQRKKYLQIESTIAIQKSVDGAPDLMIMLVIWCLAYVIKLYVEV